MMDISGRIVKEIFSGRISPDKNEIRMDGRDLAKGIYFCELKTAHQTLTTKIIVQ
jgi:hypothetical protein